MDELGRLLHAAVHARTDDWDGAQPPESVRRSIARARTLRLGGTGAVAAAVLVGFGAAGIGLTGSDPVAEPSPGATVDLSVDASVAYVTVPFPEESLEQSLVHDDKW